MIKSFTVATFVSCLAGFTCFSQQESQFINVANNPFIVNPAAGGLTDVMQFEVTSRTQWLGYKGGPRTLLFNANGQIKLKKGSKNVLSEFNIQNKAFFKNPENSIGKIKHIAGVKALNDAIGPFAKTSVYGSYAIHLPFSKRINFGVGIGIGWSNFRINQERVVLHQEDDMAYAQFIGNSSSQNFVDANAGFVFYNDRFFLGISSSQLFKNKVSFNNVATESTYNRHYIFMTKYAFELSSELSFEPVIIAKYVENSPISVDVGTRFLYKGSGWLGVYFRTSNAIVLQVGANLIKNMYLAYGFEHATGAIKSSGNSSHEIQLGFYLGNNRNVDKEIKENKKETE